MCSIRSSSHFEKRIPLRLGAEFNQPLHAERWRKSWSTKTIVTTSAFSVSQWANPPHLLITYPFVYLHQIFDTKYLHSIHAKNIFSRRRKCFSKNKWKETCFLAKNLRDDGAFLDLLENPGFPGVRKIIDSWKDRCFTFDGASFTRIVAECYDLDPALLRSSILSSAHPRHV